MSTAKETHAERTAHEPRDPSLYFLNIASITLITPSIRLFRLALPPSNTLSFLPGQWIDLYVPPSDHILFNKPGGFTITSSPSHAAVASTPEDYILQSGANDNEPMKPYKYIELAIQHAPDNPVAVYLFRPVSQLLNTEVTVRVGGSFVFPPAGDIPFKIVVFVASGMGINPLISMMSWLGEQGKDSRWRGLEVRVLYGARVSRDAWSQEAVGAEMALKPANSLLDPCKIPFLPRIAKLFSSGKLQGQVTLFLTGLNSASNPTGDVIPCENLEIAYLRRRMTLTDVQAAIGEKKGQDNSVVYVCGVPVMTDEFVGRLAAPEPEGFGMDKRRVLFEKWW